MLYSYGSANDQYDLLDKIRLFLIDAGFTINLFQEDRTIYDSAGNARSPLGSSSQRRLHASKGGKFLNFRTYDSWSSMASVNRPFKGSTNTNLSGSSTPHLGILFNMSTGFDAGLPWSSQPGSPNYSNRNRVNDSYVDAGGGLAGGVGLPTLGAVASYHLFFTENPFFFWVSAEWSVGKFGHFMTCDLLKMGSFLGGLFFTGSLAFENVGVYTTPHERHAPFIDEQGVLASHMYCRLETHPDGDTLAVAPYGWGKPWLRSSSFANGTYSEPYYRIPSSSYNSDNLTSYAVFPEFTVSTTSRDDRGACQALTALMSCCPPLLNGVAPMSPIFIPVTRANKRVSLLGVVPHMFSFSSEKVMDKETISYGGKSYVCVPFNWAVAGKARNPYFAILKA